MLSLAITSSTAVVGVAVGQAGAGPDAVVANHVATDRRHAEELTPMIERTLAEAGVTFGDLGRLVVDVGPGRFTGLRVGVATVRALALAIDRPVVGLTSLDVLAGAVDVRPVVAVVDARRGEVFQQRLDDPGPGEPSDAIVGPPADLAPLASGAAAIVGDGADRYAEVYGARVITGHNPSAAVMIGLAAGRVPVRGAEIRPLYLREPDVTINIPTRRGGGR